MRQKQLDEILVGYKTYEFATPACRRRFVAHVQRYERESKEKAMDHHVRIAWMWFWRGWFRQ